MTPSRCLAVRVALVLLATLLLAGCSDPTSGNRAPPAVSDSPAAILGLEATPTLGVLLGVAVDEAIRPLGNVTVQVASTQGPARTTQSRADGLWGFADLEAGTYVVSANRSGHVPVQTVATVRAGVPDPPLVHLVLDTDPDQQPYVVALSFDGFLPCGLRGGTGGVHCAQITQTRAAMSDRSTILVPVEAGPSWVQLEVHWDATQPLSDQMGLYIRQVPNDDGNDAYMGIYPLNQGPSPVVLAVDGDGVGHCHTCVEEPLNHTRWQEMDIAVRSGELSATTPPPTCSPTGSPCLAGVGATVNQKFQLFVHILYRATPPPDWLFSRDGPPIPPS